jgi:hypothetical protein
MRSQTCGEGRRGKPDAERRIARLETKIKKVVEKVPAPEIIAKIHSTKHASGEIVGKFTNIRKALPLSRASVRTWQRRTATRPQRTSPQGCTAQRAGPAASNGSSHSR